MLVVDDHTFVRRGVRAYLEAVPSFRMLGEACDGEQALALLRQCRTTGEPMPDVVLMDLQMPRLGGVEATEAIARAHPEVKVVVLTSFGEVERVHAALAAGTAAPRRRSWPSGRGSSRRPADPRSPRRPSATDDVAVLRRTGRPRADEEPLMGAIRLPTVGAMTTTSASRPRHAIVRACARPDPAERA
jgi:CheY-like chemotaxis protein